MKEKIQTISPLVDRFFRTISYLRLSLTDRCNLRCLYCMPEGLEKDEKNHSKTAFLNHADLLSYEELLRLVGIGVCMGMNKLRLTGGEPLVRKGVMDFIHQLSRIDGLEQIRLTTNGVLLKEHAEGLFEAGVRQINVSLDTLQRQKFQKITGRDYYSRVRAGISAARDLGFTIKLNVVAIRGINDDECINFARLALEQPFQVRFIEFMPVGNKSTWNEGRFIEAEEIKKLLSPLGTLSPCRKAHGEGPARMYELESIDGRKGRIGFISPISHHFCGQCNRLRLTSEGKLRSCLLNDDETDLKLLIREGASDQEIAESIRKTILAKPKGHSLYQNLSAGGISCGGRMSKIGG